MSRTGNRPGQPSKASLTLITGSLILAGCAAKVELGQSSGDGKHLTSFQRLSARPVTAIDLLLMIDNSSSMADKQATLAAAVPQLLGQLVQPKCVDAQGNPTGSVAVLGASAPCVTGTPEFNPIHNIHIGIVTSSLGDHGANSICSPGTPTQYLDPATYQPINQPIDVNDLGHLMGTLDRAELARSDAQTAYATLNALGFLEWGNAQLPSLGTADLSAATQIFSDLVAAAHEVGCAYESQLESWFRFLIDPVPPVLPLDSPDHNTNYTHRTGSDDTLLNQRAAFLRPDSLVAIVMLTDENDCSIRDMDVGWVAATTSSLITRGSDQCAANPNDKCCYSCTAGTPSTCANGCIPAGIAVDDGIYQASIRCWNQKRRFGYEFLYPVSRYVVALTKAELCPDQTFGDMDCDCTYAKSIGAGCDPGIRRMPNPLYSSVVGTLNNNQTLVSQSAAVPRADNSLVVLGGIVGVPWQDIGRMIDGHLEYIPVTDLAWTVYGVGTQPDNSPPAGSNGIWDMIYGNDNANIAPRDPHMLESIVPRDGLPGPYTAANADPFNGHDYNTARGSFEYACTYNLPAARPCECASGDGYAACKYLHANECCDQSFQADGAGGPGGDYNKPICSGTTQTAAAAYPGLREIQVLHDYALSPAAAVSGNAVIGSVCPADLVSNPTSPGYGYNPFASALVDTITQKLKPSCNPSPLTLKADGTVPCVIAEAVPEALFYGNSCAAYCANNQRTSPGAAVVADVTAAMQNDKVCDNVTIQCSSMCICQLPQAAGVDLATCQNATDGSDVALAPGFCYVDPERGAGNSELVKKCPSNSQRVLRYVGNNPTGAMGITVPLKGAFVYLSCNSNYN